MRLVIRFLQRLLILGLGIFTVWLIVFVIFRFADHRLPWILAVGVTYGVAAYVVLPRAIRMGLKILQRKSVPSFTITGDGLPGDPVNIVLMGKLSQLRAAFATAGWTRPTGWASPVRGAWRGPSYSTRPIRARHSAPSICSDAAKTSGSRKPSITARASAIIFDFGP